jgi:hypothetical protein
MKFFMEERIQKRMEEELMPISMKIVLISGWEIMKRNPRKSSMMNHG